MLAAVGAIIPEYLAMTGVDIGEPIWSVILINLIKYPPRALR
jgi:hypothetical protein